MKSKEHRFQLPEKEPSSPRSASLGSKKDSKDQESIQSSTTPVPGYTNGKVTKSQKNITSKNQELSPFPSGDHKAAMSRRESMTNTIEVRKRATIRNRYNQVPHLSLDTKWESNKITINITNKNQEVSPFPSGDHKAAMSRRESMTNTIEVKIEKKCGPDRTSPI